MFCKIFLTIAFSGFILAVCGQVPQPIRHLLKADYMEGATFSLMAKEVESGETLYCYDERRQVTPASVLKIVTTATALELLGEDFRFPTTLEYTGEIADGVLKGDLYIRGSGDPSLGSAHGVADRNSFTLEQAAFIPQWIDAIRKAGIERIEGTVIADETIFDTEGISPKWLQEDIGSYYGAGSYGLNVFDNLYHLYLSSGAAGTTPRITGTEPDMPSLRFYNYLKAETVSTDSAFIIGGPYSTERYLYGVVAANQNRRVIKGDIPDPPLFLAQYFRERLKRENIEVKNESASLRNGIADPVEPLARKELVTTYSRPLKELIRIVNERSHNLYADAIFKTTGLGYRAASGEVISTFGRGIRATENFWKDRGLKTSALQIYDGSGLAATDKVSAAFITDILTYMAAQSPDYTAFIESLPLSGREGTVRNFLKGSALEGRARLKSGGMSRVKSYAGYITTRGGKTYAVAVFVNNYNCDGRVMTRALERMLTALF